MSMAVCRGSMHWETYISYELSGYLDLLDWGNFLTTVNMAQYIVDKYQ